MTNPRIPRLLPTAWLVSLCLSACGLPWLQAADNPPAPANDAPIALKLRWPEGRRLVQRQEVKGEMEMNMPGANAPVLQTTRQLQEFSVKALKTLENGGQELELEFLRTQMEVKMAENVMMSYDSAAPPSGDANPIAATLGKLIGVKLKFITDPQGQIEKVEGLKELTDKLLGDLEGPAKLTAESFMSEDNLKRLGVGLQGLPEKPVKVGDQWPVKSQVSLGPLGTATSTLQFRFADWETRAQRRCIRLEFTGTIASTPAEEGKAPFQLTIENGKTSGSLWFDPAAGQVIESQADQEMNLNMAIQGQTANMKMKQKVTGLLTESK